MLGRSRTFFSLTSVCRTARKARRFISTKVPQNPTWKAVIEKDLPPVTHVDPVLVEHLERLALVDFSNKDAVERINSAIRFADQLFMVNTEGIEPQYSVLEDRALYLRKDEVKEGNMRKELLAIANKKEDEYYVAPPGNIPLKKKSGDDTTYEGV